MERKGTLIFVSMHLNNQVIPKHLDNKNIEISRLYVDFENWSPEIMPHCCKRIPSSRATRSTHQWTKTNIPPSLKMKIKLAYNIRGVKNLPNIKKLGHAIFA